MFTDYDQYENWVLSRAKEEAKAAREEQAQRKAAAAGPVAVQKRAGKKLTFKEQQEWDTMEATILESEEAVQKWHKTMEDPTVMMDRNRLNEACDKMHLAQERVVKLYERWQELEEKMNG